MITRDIIQRTFHVRHGTASGTAFVIDRDDRQYLITARHVVPDIAPRSAIEIFHDRQWKTIQIEVVGAGAGQADVAVLACPLRLVPPHVLEASSAGLMYGQQVYFLGFPFGWDSGAENLNREFPIPFVKAGIVSAMSFGEASLIYIDAHGNQGFSGGPVVYELHGTSETALRVAGIVAEAPTPLLRPVVDSLGRPLTADEEPIAYFAENQGIVVAISIRHATDLIDANPIGFSLHSG